jgi:hypothetical protein
MKSERRHELQHNTLADWLATTFETIKPYQNHILAGVTLLIVVIGGITIWRHNAEGQNASAWKDYLRAIETGNTANLVKVVEQYPDTEAAQAAKLASADIHFAKGCEQLFVSRGIAQQELDKAIDLYQDVLKKGDTPPLHEVATLGLARSKEACGDKESLAEAVKYYAEIVTNWPSGGCAVLAKERLTNLKRPETQKLYADFHNFDPKPSYSEQGTSDKQFPFPLPGSDTNTLPPEPPIGSIESTLNQKSKTQDKPAATLPLDLPAGSMESTLNQKPKAQDKPGDLPPLEALPGSIESSLNQKPKPEDKPAGKDIQFPGDTTPPSKDAPPPEKKVPDKAEK